MSVATFSSVDRESLLEKTAAQQLTVCVRHLGFAEGLVKRTGRRAWLSEIERLAVEVKKVRDAMYAEQGPL